MTMTTIGNMAQFFLTQRNNVQLRQRLDSLTAELSTNQKQDLPRALGFDTARLSEIDRRLSMIGAFRNAASETGQTLVAIQEVLGRADQIRGTLATALVNADFQSSPIQQEGLATSARSAFTELVSAFNTRYAGRSVLAGAATDRPALAPAADMIASIEAAVSGALTVADVESALDTWFDDPLGGFATFGYSGDTGPMPSRTIDEGVPVTIEARADRAELRNLLKAAAKGFAGQTVAALTTTDRTTLFRQSGLDLMSAAEPLTGLASVLGASEARVAESRGRLTSEETVLGQARNDMVSADPFTTATALRELETQLETHYALTARLSRLSLSEYL